MIQSDTKLTDSFKNGYKKILENTVKFSYKKVAEKYLVYYSA